MIRLLYDFINRLAAVEYGQNSPMTDLFRICRTRGILAAVSENRNVSMR